MLQLPLLVPNVFTATGPEKQIYLKMFWTFFFVPFFYLMYWCSLVTVLSLFCIVSTSTLFKGDSIAIAACEAGGQWLRALEVFEALEAINDVCCSELVGEGSRKVHSFVWRCCFLRVMPKWRKIFWKMVEWFGKWFEVQSFHREGQQIFQVVLQRFELQSGKAMLRLRVEFNPGYILYILMLSCYDMLLLWYYITIFQYILLSSLSLLSSSCIYSRWLSVLPLIHPP